MATNITIENAIGTELLIPEAGEERRGEINIIANNGFFKAERTDKAVIPFTNNIVLTNAGATITGNNEDITTDKMLENIPDTIFGFRFIRASDNNTATGFATKLDGQSATVDNLTKNGDDHYETQTFQNVHNQDVNVLRKTNKGSNTIGCSKDNIVYDGDECKLFLPVYIENDNIDANTIFFEADRSIRIYRDGYQVYTDSWQNKVNYPDNYVMPVQDWVSLEINTIANKKIDLLSTIKSITIIDSNKTTDIPNINSKNSYGGSSITMNIGKNGDNTDNNYIKYAPIIFISISNATSLLGQNSIDAFLNKIRNLITPV